MTTFAESVAAQCQNGTRSEIQAYVEDQLGYRDHAMCDEVTSDVVAELVALGFVEVIISERLC